MNSITEKSTEHLHKNISDLEENIRLLNDKSRLMDRNIQLELAEAYKALADINFRQSKYEEARKLFSQAFYIYNQLNNYHGLIACKNATASICLAKGELPAAKNKLEELLLLLKKSPNKKYEHVVLNNLGIVYDKSGDLTRSVLYFHRSLAIKKELDKPILPTYTLHNLANIYYQVEDYETALKYNHMALDSIEDTDDFNAKASIFNGIAQTLSKKGRHNEAKKYFTDAKVLATNINNSAQIAEALTGLGHLEFKKGDFSLAKKLLTQSLETYQNLEEQENIVRCLIDLAKIYQNQDIDKALAQVKEATKLCKINGYRSLLAIVYQLTGNLMATQKDYAKAYYYNQMYVDLYIETNKTNILNQVEVNRLSIELENVQSESKQFQNKAEKLEHESTHDHLTGAGNRRQLDRTISESWKQKSSQQYPNHLVMLDIDDFKFVNDNFSHELGDQVLRTISSIINSCIRENDRLFRYGGEEFIILVKDNSVDKTLKTFELIRHQIQNHNWSQFNPSLKVTATLGMVSNNEQEFIDKALQIADERMYQGKNSGKNILVSA
jgi:diguanylate cyclase (GGDEF)-like protein